MSTLKVGTIQDPTNSNTAISIDSSGVMNLGQKVGWHIYGTTDNGGQVTHSPVRYHTVDFDYQNGWSSSNYEYTIAKAGLYLIGWTQSQDAENARWYLQADTGSGYSEIDRSHPRKPAGGNTNAPRFILPFVASVGDKLRVIPADSTSYWSFGPTSRVMHFWGVMIG